MSLLDSTDIDVKPPLYMGYMKLPDGGRFHIWFQGIKPENAWEWEEPHGQYYEKDKE